MFGETDRRTSGGDYIIVVVVVGGFSGGGGGSLALCITCTTPAIGREIDNWFLTPSKNRRRSHQGIPNLPTKSGLACVCVICVCVQYLCLKNLLSFFFNVCAVWVCSL